MEEVLHLFAENLHWLPLLGVIAACIVVLGKGADWLVSESVTVSSRWGVPKVVVGATIVSLGTTAPEAAVSVLAALQGKPDFALGNAVGSVICDTGLVLGLACIIAPLPLEKRIVNRQGWIQVAAGVLLVISCWPYENPGSAFSEGGSLPQVMGFIFTALLVWYLWQSIRWAKTGGATIDAGALEAGSAKPLCFVFFKFAMGLILVVVSSSILIPAVGELATRIGVPRSVVAATLVAFGTSLPELVTAITAARRGHGDLAVGNVVGADILNVLFVAGLSAAVTPEGLSAGPHFFRLIFPTMILLLVVFRIAIFVSGGALKRGTGFLLLAIYGGFTILNYLIKSPMQ